MKVFLGGRTREGRELSVPGKMTQWAKHLTYKIWGLEFGSLAAPLSWKHSMCACNAGALWQGGKQRKDNDP